MMLRSPQQRFCLFILLLSLSWKSIRFCLASTQPESSSTHHVSFSWRHLGFYIANGFSNRLPFMRDFRDRMIESMMTEYIQFRKLGCQIATDDVSLTSGKYQNPGQLEAECFQHFVREQISSYSSVDLPIHAEKSYVTIEQQSSVVSDATLLALQISLIIVIWKKQRTTPNMDAEHPSLASTGLLPSWSFLAVLYHGCKIIATRGKQNVDWRSWQLSRVPLLVCIGVLMLGILYLKGFKVGLVLIVDWMLNYETVVLQIALVLDGVLHLITGNTSRRVPNLRNKPRFAVLLGIQVSIWHWLPKFSPVTAVITLCILLDSNSQVEFLTNAQATPALHCSSKFCKTCTQKILAAWEADVQDSSAQVHHRTERGLKQAVAEGCRICNAVWEQRLRTPYDFWGSVILWKPVTSFELDSRVAVVYQEGNRDLRTYRCEFDINDPRIHTEDPHDSDTSSQNYVECRDLDSHTSSISSLVHARRSFQTCLRLHRCSPLPQPGASPPSRLLFLGPLPSKQVGSLADLDLSELRLISRTGDQVRYMTLSHCWGGKDTIRLLRSNKQQFSRGVPFDGLPATFRDAMRLVKWLGCQYLWIDSLCIIQDDDQDCIDEIGRMGDIYRNALCNIAASDAGNSEIGCFFHRNVRAVQPEILQINGKSRVLLNRQDIYRSDHVLYTRAWFLQEAYLAPRTIDCGKGQIFWRCGEKISSEIFPYGVSRAVLQLTHPADALDNIELEAGGSSVTIMNIGSWEANLRSLRNSLGSSIAQPNRGPCPASYHHPFGSWSIAVQTFTGMKLSVKDDRINALAGIINTLKPHLGNNLAGLWECFLPFELLWRIESRSEIRHPRRAPSWSWQSSDCFVSYQQCFFDPERDMLITSYMSVRAIIKTDQQHVEMGLVLFGPLLRAAWSPDDDPGPHTKARHPLDIHTLNGNRRHFVIGTYKVPFLSDKFGDIYLDEQSRSQKPESVFNLFRDDSPVKDVFCLPIVRKNAPRGILPSHIPDAGHSYLVGLVLKRLKPDSTGNQTQLYERIGCFESNGLCMSPYLDGTSSEEIIIV